MFFDRLPPRAHWSQREKKSLTENKRCAFSRRDAVVAWCRPVPHERRWRTASGRKAARPGEGRRATTRTSTPRCCSRSHTFSAELSARMTRTRRRTVRHERDARARGRRATRSPTTRPPTDGALRTARLSPHRPAPEAHGASRLSRESRSPKLARHWPAAKFEQIPQAPQAAIATVGETACARIPKPPEPASHT